MDPISITAMVFTIIGAIFAGNPVFKSLWLKLKMIFSSGEASRVVLGGIPYPTNAKVPETNIRNQNREVLERTLRSLLEKDGLLMREARSYYARQLENTSGRVVGDFSRSGNGWSEHFDNNISDCEDF
jgi:hypothetical protein